MRRVLVGVQVALAVVMLSTAALLGRSLDKLQRLSLAFREDHLSFLAIGFPLQRYFATREQIFPLGDRVMAQLRSDPNVAAASPVLVPPLVGADVWRWPFEIEGQSPDVASPPNIPIEVGHSALFGALGIRVLRGRTFDQSDMQGGQLVAVISESVARRYWPRQDALGKRIRLPATSAGGDGWRTVIGIVDDLHYRTLREAFRPCSSLGVRRSGKDGLLSGREGHCPKCSAAYDGRLRRSSRVFHSRKRRRLTTCSPLHWPSLASAPF